MRLTNRRIFVLTTIVAIAQSLANRLRANTQLVTTPCMEVLRANSWVQANPPPSDPNCFLSNAHSLCNAVEKAQGKCGGAKIYDIDNPIVRAELDQLIQEGVTRAEEAQAQAEADSALTNGLWIGASILGVLSGIFTFGTSTAATIAAASTAIGAGDLGIAASGVGIDQSMVDEMIEATPKVCADESDLCAWARSYEYTKAFIRDEIDNEASRQLKNSLKGYYSELDDVVQILSESIKDVLRAIENIGSNVDDFKQKFMLLFSDSAPEGVKRAWRSLENLRDKMDSERYDFLHSASGNAEEDLRLAQRNFNFLTPAAILHLRVSSVLLLRSIAHIATLDSGSLKNSEVNIVLTEITQHSQLAGEYSTSMEEVAHLIKENRMSQFRLGDKYNVITAQHGWFGGGSNFHNDFDDCYGTQFAYDDNNIGCTDGEEDKWVFSQENHVDRGEAVYFAFHGYKYQCLCENYPAHCNVGPLVEQCYNWRHSFVEHHLDVVLENVLLKPANEMGNIKEQAEQLKPMLQTKLSEDKETLISYIVDNLNTATSSLPGPPSDGPPSDWTCSNGYYNTNDGCDCGCGARDPDCDRDEPGTIYNCDDGTTCVDHSTGVCVHESWTCSNDYYNADDGCDCDCGAYDPDCDRDEPGTIYNCDDGETCVGQSSGLCSVSSDPSSGPPSGWTCSDDYYNAEDGCDCNCGVRDPDCDGEDPTIYGCDDGETCVGSTDGSCPNSGSSLLQNTIKQLLRTNQKQKEGKKSGMKHQEKVAFHQDHQKQLRLNKSKEHQQESAAFIHKKSALKHQEKLAFYQEHAKQVQGVKKTKNHREHSAAFIQEKQKYYQNRKKH